MLIHVGCDFDYEVGYPTSTVLQVQPHRDGAHRLLRETWETRPALLFQEYHDLYDNTCQRFVMPPGDLFLRYDALVEVPDSKDEVVHDAAQVPIEDLPDAALLYTLPSRYCLSDALSDVAWDLFGGTEPGWARVQAVCDWVHEHIRFQYGTSTPLTTASDVYEARVGVVGRT